MKGMNKYPRVNKKVSPIKRELFRAEIAKGKTKKEAAEAIGVGNTDTVWMGEVQEEVAETYREQVIKAMKKLNIGASKYASKLGELLECGRIILSEDGNREKITDNTNQIRALIELGDILGVKAPKEIELKVENLTDKERDERLNRIKDRLLIGSGN